MLPTFVSGAYYHHHDYHCADAKDDNQNDDKATDNEAKAKVSSEKQYGKE